MPALATTVVVPTVGRPSLHALLERLADLDGPRPHAVIVVDDSGVGRAAGELAGRPGPGCPLTVLESQRRGPAAARNLGWRAARTPWVSFLDDDVLPEPGWLTALETDLGAAGEDVGGVAARIRVPQPQNRRPTDWERGTAGLETSAWITADMTYRRSALAAVGGFDERFTRAFREDADLALRVQAAGARLVQGSRCTCHPVRPADDWVSVRVQAGNADDALMRRVHGPAWREHARAPRGRRRRHVAITTAGAAGVLAGATGRGRACVLLLAGWLAGTAELAAARILPGPRDRAEVRRMLLTSLVIPPAATWHTARGLWRHRAAGPWRGLPDLVLFDRDGTLVHDVPYNGDPALALPVPRARQSIDRLRQRGVRVGVVTNQSGIGGGRLTRAQVEGVNRRVEELLGPFDVWQMCPHTVDDGCGCRKPAPGMVKQACAQLDVDPARCVVIGDIGRDVDAAEAAGASAVLVPTPVTRREEVEAAPAVEPDLAAAVDRVLEGAW
jgi:HAD superfamily hydrolase (TIGR01662 family)